MQPEFIEHTQVNPAMEQMFQVMSTMMMQENHTNQTLMTWLTNQSTSATPSKQKDSRIRPRSFSRLPTEDIRECCRLP